MVLDRRLNERSYGVFELCSYDSWDALRELDLNGEQAGDYKAETSIQMLERVAEVYFEEMRGAHRRYTFFVSHADLLQAFELLSTDTIVQHYSEQPYLACGEFKPIT